MRVEVCVPEASISSEALLPRAGDEGAGTVISAHRHRRSGFNYSAVGVAEYRASLIATSRGSPASATLLRLGMYP
jgi:hypothetical protein